MADASFEQFFSGGGASIGLFPVFPPKKPLRSNGAPGPRGFLGDGDRITLPQTLGATAQLQYTNAAGSVVWTKVPTDIDASCDAWLSFSLDTVDGVLWVAAFDEAANRVYTATINAAGTIVAVGNATTVTDLTAASHGWGASLTAKRGASMRRATQGAGSFTVIAEGLRFTLSHTTGAISAETAITNLQGGAFQSSSGVYFSPRNYSNVSTTVFTPGTQELFAQIPTASNAAYLQTASLQVPTYLGLPSHANPNGLDNYVALSWAGDILLTAPVLTTMVARSIYDPIELLDAFDALVNNFRMDVL